jgi:hypothetical protein
MSCGASTGWWIDSIHPSAWKGFSPTFAGTAFSEVHSKGRSTPGSPIRLAEGWLSDLRGGALLSSARLRPARQSLTLPRPEFPPRPPQRRLRRLARRLRHERGQPPCRRDPRSPRGPCWPARCPPAAVSYASRASRPELGVEALFAYQPDRPFGEFDLYPLGPKAARRGLLGRATFVFFDG